MDTPEKINQSNLPLLTPKTASGSQRVIKQIMVIDPNKLRLAGLDVKMAEALKKSKPKSQSKPKESKLSLAKSLLNKKLRETISKKVAVKEKPSQSQPSPPQTAASPPALKIAQLAATQITSSTSKKTPPKAKPKISVATLKSLMPPPSFPMSSLISPNQTVKIKVLKAENTKQSIEVKIVDSDRKKVKKLEEFPKASLHTKAQEPQKTLKTEEITPEMRFGVSKKCVLSDSSESEVTASDCEESLILHLGENNNPATLVEAPLEQHDTLQPIQSEESKKDEELQTLQEKEIESTNSEKKVEETVETTTTVKENLSSLNSEESVVKEVPENRNPSIYDDSFVEDGLDDTNSEGSLVIDLPEDSYSHNHDEFSIEDGSNATCTAEFLPQIGFESPQKLFITSTPTRHVSLDALPKVIESKVLTADEQIDLSLLTKKTPVGLTVPKKRYKLDQNWISSESNPDEETLETTLTPTKNADESNSKANLSATTPKAEESAIDFINNLSMLFADSQTPKSKAKSVTKKLTKECSEDATSFLVSLFQKKKENPSKISQKEKTLKTEEDTKVEEKYTNVNDTQTSRTDQILESTTKPTITQILEIDKTNSKKADNSTNKDPASQKTSPETHAENKVVSESSQSERRSMTIEEAKEKPSEESVKTDSPVENTNNMSTTISNDVKPTEIKTELNTPKVPEQISSVTHEAPEKPKPSTAPTSTRRKAKPIPVVVAKLKKSRKPNATTQKPPEAPAQPPVPVPVPEKSIEKPVEESPTQPVQNKDEQTTSGPIDERSQTNTELTSRKRKETVDSPSKQPPSETPEELLSPSKSERPKRQRKISLKLSESPEFLSTIPSAFQEASHKTIEREVKEIKESPSKISPEKSQRQRKVSFKLLDDGKLSISLPDPPEHQEPKRKSSANDQEIKVTPSSERPQRQRKASLKLLESTESMSSKIDQKGEHKQCSDNLIAVEVKEVSNDPISQLDAFHESVEKFEIACGSLKSKNIEDIAKKQDNLLTEYPFRDAIAKDLMLHKQRQSEKLKEQQSCQSAESKGSEPTRYSTRKRKDFLKSRNVSEEQIEILSNDSTPSNAHYEVSKETSLISKETVKKEETKNSSFNNELTDVVAEETSQATKKKIETMPDTNNSTSNKELTDVVSQMTSQATEKIKEIVCDKNNSTLNNELTNVVSEEACPIPVKKEHSPKNSEKLQKLKPSTSSNDTPTVEVDEVLVRNEDKPHSKEIPSPIKQSKNTSKSPESMSPQTETSLNLDISKDQVSSITLLENEIQDKQTLTFPINFDHPLIFSEISTNKTKPSFIEISETSSSDIISIDSQIEYNIPDGQSTSTTVGSILNLPIEIDGECVTESSTFQIDLLSESTTIVEVSHSSPSESLSENQAEANVDLFEELKSTQTTDSSKSNETKAQETQKENLILDLDHIDSSSFSPLHDSTRISKDSQEFEELDKDLTSAIIETVVAAEKSAKEEEIGNNLETSQTEQILCKLDSVKSSLSSLSQANEVDVSETALESPTDTPKRTPQSTSSPQKHNHNTSMLSAVLKESKGTENDRRAKKPKNPFKSQTSEKKESLEESISESDFLGFNEKEIEEGQQSTSLRLSQSEDLDISDLQSSLKAKSKSQTLSGKKPKQEKQKWEKKSAKSLMNWLSKKETPPTEKSDDVCDIKEDSHEQSSSVPPKKRRNKIDNQNENQNIEISNETAISGKPTPKDDERNNSILIKEKPKRGRPSKLKNTPKTEEKSTTNLKDLSDKIRSRRNTRLSIDKEDTIRKDETPKRGRRASRFIETPNEKEETPKRGRKSSKVIETPNENKDSKQPTNKRRKSKVSMAESTEIEFEKSSISTPEPTKKTKAALKRKRSMSEEKQHEEEQTTSPSKLPHLSESLLLSELYQPKKKLGRPSTKNISKPSPPTTPECPTKRKYKDDYEFNPRLLLIRNREELKTNDPLVDPTLQTERKSPDDVQCALCMGYTSQKSWAKHITSHYGIGWIVGMPAPLDIHSRGSILSFMIDFFKVSKVKGLNCRLCNSMRRSALGMLMHLEQCGLSKEELAESRLVCEYCKKDYSKASFLIHKRTCPEYLKLVLEESKTQTTSEKKDEDDKANDEALSNTGRFKRKSVIKAESKLKNLNEALDFVPEELIKHIPKESLPSSKSIKETWTTEIDTLGKGFCASKRCPFTSTTLDGLNEHYKETVCQYFQKPGYFCMKCKFHNENKDAVRSHIIDKHSPKPKNQVDSEADFSSSASSASISSGDDEEDSNEEGSLDLNESVAKKAKRSKKSKVKKVARPFCVKNPPTKEYRRLLPDRQSDIEKIVAKQFESFVKKNYTREPLFEFAKTHFTYLDSVESYLPKLEESIKFTHNKSKLFVKSLGRSEVDPKQWKQLERLHARTEQDEYTMFMGGPVKNISWIPLDPHPSSSHTQYLAVTVRKDFNKFSRFLNQKFSRSLIFILKFDKSSKSRIKGEISYAVAIDDGPIHAIEFLPSGGYLPELNRLGMLAVGSIETEIKIYSLPLLVVEKRDCDLFPIIQLESSMELHLEVPSDNVSGNTDNYHSQCTCLTWSKSAGHNIIVGGFLNSFVGIWNVCDDADNLNRFVVNGKRTFTPISYFWTTEDRLMQLALHYDMNGPRWMAVSNSMRKLMVYDLREITDPVLFRVDITLNSVSSIDWPVVWENFLYGLGDIMPSNGCLASCYSPMSLMFVNRRFDKFCAGVSDISYNMWKNCTACGAENGDIQIVPMREFTLDVSQRLKTDVKTVSTVDIVPFNKEEKISVTNLQIPEDGKRVFDKDYQNHYGIVFGPIKRFSGRKKSEFYSSNRVPPLNLQRLVRINKLTFNPNKNACDLLAVGYNNGLIRVITSDWLNEESNV